MYRGIVARELGRPLKSHEIVHHVNGDYTDNRLNNLVLFSSQHAHILVHAYLRREVRGAVLIFPIDEILQPRGERIIWATETGRCNALKTGR